MVWRSRWFSVRVLTVSLLNCRIQDTARAKEILGATATLEFRLVNTNVDQAAAASGRVPATLK
ncbi:hypothetical protein FA041_03825 [Escherichia coli]|nr:hypothetical protein [Escherichia coli]